MFYITCKPYLKIGDLQQEFRVCVLLYSLEQPLDDPGYDTLNLLIIQVVYITHGECLA